LAEAGLVSTQMDGHFKMYELRLNVIQGMAQHLLAQDTLPQVAAEVDHTAYDRQVVRAFTRRDGSLKDIPAQQKKLLAVLRHIVPAFEPGRQYPEKEVNDILRRYHADTASLRRYLISYKLMQRANGLYWRTEGDEP
jgi:hypothetical protein